MYSILPTKVARHPSGTAGSSPLIFRYNCSVSLLTVQVQQVDFLLKVGRYKEAAELYNEILPHKDRLRTTELVNQLDELHTIFEVDKLTLRNEVIICRLKMR